MQKMPEQFKLTFISRWFRLDLEGKGWVAPIYVIPFVILLLAVPAWIWLFVS